MKKTFGITKTVGRLVEKYSYGLCLDVGCGTGEYFPLIKGNIVGIDKSDDYLNKINISDFTNLLSLHKGDIRKLPFENKKFNFVLCSEVLEYVPSQELVQAFQELERVSSEDGVIIISVPNKNCIFNWLRNFWWDNKYGEPNKQYTNMGITYTVKDLKNFGFKVHGCFGFVSREKIGFDFLFDILDFFAWSFPNLGGTLVGIKIIKNKLYA